MPTPEPVIQQIACHFRHVHWSLTSTPCDQCHQPARRVWDASRTAIDIDLSHLALLLVTVSVHHCPSCHHYFRVQPSFLRPDATYTNRVVAKALASVYEDRMAMRRVPQRLARDFWVQPSEAMVRRWCKESSANLDFERDYQPWVVAEFSGILCVDEVYQDRLALLLAVDPAAPDGDRLVGYQLVHGTVDQPAVELFFTRLQTAGVAPEQVITDGSALYPALIAKIWPTAAHQLCLFHETRHVTRAVEQVVNAVRRSLPTPPPAPPRGRGGPLRPHPPTTKASDPAAQRWEARQAARRASIAEIHGLRQQGLSERAIARQTGVHRQTVRRWLDESDGAPEPAVIPHSVPTPVSEIAVVEMPQEAPPAPWASWEEVRQVREALKEHRFLFVHRPDHLTPEEQAHLNALLASPAGNDLQIARTFLEEWYGIWRDDQGNRRSVEEAEARYRSWRTNASSATLTPLRKRQAAVTDGQFTKLSQFLREPTWEATNNGAERTGRAFRHEQGPHYTLRTAEAISATLTVEALLRKASSTEGQQPPRGRCSRGRKAKTGAVRAA